MSYEVNNFVDGSILTAMQLNKMDNQIAANEAAIERNSGIILQRVDDQVIDGDNVFVCDLWYKRPVGVEILEAGFLMSKNSPENFNPTYIRYFVLDYESLNPPMTIQKSSFMKAQYPGIDSDVYCLRGRFANDTMIYARGFIRYMSGDEEKVLYSTNMVYGKAGQFTKKTRIDYDGTNFKLNGVTLNYEKLYNIHLINPDFAFVVYGDRAYLLSYVQDDSGMKEMRFQSTIAVTDASGFSYTKTSGIYVTSSDGINIASVRVADINSENNSYKANEITESNKKNSVMYPSVKAVTDLTDSLSESIIKISEVVGTEKKVVTTTDFVFGHIDGSGSVVQNNNKNLCFNKKIYASKGSTVKVDSGYKYQIGLYDTTTEIFIKRITWLYSNDVYRLESDYKVIVEISDESESVLSDFSIVSHLHCELVQPYGKMAFINGKNVPLNYPIGTVISLAPSDVSYYRYSIVNCEQNDVFFINAMGGVTPRVWGFIDKDNKLLSVADSTTAGKQQTDLKIIAPKNASKLIVNDQKTGGVCLICDKVRSNRFIINDFDKTEELTRIAKLESDISNVNNNIEILEDGLSHSTENLSNVVDAIGMDMFSKHAVTVSKPWKYTAWSFIGSIANKLVCLYSRGNAHEDSNGFDVYAKTSTNGVIWSKEKVLFNEPNVRENITGKGFDQGGNLFVWLRKGVPGGASTVHELWKTTDGETFIKVSSPTFPVVCGHIGDIVLQPYTTNLFAFFNTYGSKRSWGILKSTDNGVTWMQTVIESEIDASECPVEISGTYISSGRMIAMGRKDVTAVGSTNAMFQMQSSNYGSTWTKQYTNITDIAISTPSIVNTNNGHLNLFYFERGLGKLRLRQNDWSDVWDNPTNWSTSEVIATGTTNAQDTGNVNACAFKDHTIATYYSGNSIDTGIYSVIV